MSNNMGFAGTTTATTIPSKSKADILIDAYWRAYESYKLKFPDSHDNDAKEFAAFIVDQIPK